MSDLISRDEVINTLKRFQVCTNLISAIMQLPNGETIKPCPFCGGKAVVAGFNTKNGYMETVKCTVCRASSGLYGHFDNAIRAWNLREEDEE